MFCFERLARRTLTLFGLFCLLPKSSYVIFLGIVVLEISLAFINSDSLSALHFSCVFVISIVCSTRMQLHFLFRRSMIEFRMVFQHIDSVQFAHLVYLSFLFVASTLSVLLDIIVC